jgi:hypothetical protein
MGGAAISEKPVPSCIEPAMNDFNEVIAQAKKEYRPFWDYSQWTDEDLIIFYVRVIAWGCLGVSRILNTKGAAPFLRTTAELISKFAGTPDADHLKYLFAIYSDVRPLKALVWLAIERKRITYELYDRHKEFEAGMTLLAENEGAWQAESIEDYHKLLAVKYRGGLLRSGDPQKEEDADVRSVAMVGGLEFFCNRKDKIEVKDYSEMPVPPFKYGMVVSPWVHRMGRLDKA